MAVAAINEITKALEKGLVVTDRDIIGLPFVFDVNVPHLLARDRPFFFLDDL